MRIVGSILTLRLRTRSRLRRRDRGSMVRVPIGNSKSMRVEVRSVVRMRILTLTLYSIFKTGLDGKVAGNRQPSPGTALICPETSIRPSKTSPVRNGSRRFSERTCRVALPISSALRRIVRHATGDIVYKGSEVQYHTRYTTRPLEPLLAICHGGGRLRPVPSSGAIPFGGVPLFAVWGTSSANAR